jgi:Ser/Thr protein kinase RdoA (MazF antagonist)
MIGKLYRAQRGAAIFAQMRQLWQANPRCAMPQPLGYWPELGMVFQEPAPGQPLHSLLADDSLAMAVEAAGQNLARLHTVSIPELPVRQTMAEHLAKYCNPHPQQMAMELAARRPELSGEVETILHTLLNTSMLADAPLCTVHNDLNLAHVYWHANTTYFIDFDGLCRSHPALDLANFRVALQVYLGGQGEVLGRRFLDAYLSASPPVPVSALDLYTSFTYLRRAVICYRRKAESDWPAALAALVKAGLNALG